MPGSIPILSTVSTAWQRYQDARRQRAWNPLGQATPPQIQMRPVQPQPQQSSPPQQTQNRPLPQQTNAPDPFMPENPPPQPELSSYGSFDPYAGWSPWMDEPEVKVGPVQAAPWAVPQMPSWDSMPRFRPLWLQQPQQTQWGGW